jgi:hypothetical protein
MDPPRRRLLAFAAGLVGSMVVTATVFYAAPDWFFLLIPAGAVLLPVAGLAFIFGRGDSYRHASVVGWVMLGYALATLVQAFELLAGGAA